MCACVHRWPVRKKDKREELMSKKGLCQHFLLKWHWCLYNTVFIPQNFFFVNWLFFKKDLFSFNIPIPVSTLFPPLAPSTFPFGSIHSSSFSSKVLASEGTALHSHQLRAGPHVWVCACVHADGLRPARVPSGVTSVETGSVQNATFLFINN